MRIRFLRDFPPNHHKGEVVELDTAAARRLVQFGAAEAAGPSEAKPAPEEPADKCVEGSPHDKMVRKRRTKKRP